MGLGAAVWAIMSYLAALDSDSSHHPGSLIDNSMTTMMTTAIVSALSGRLWDWLPTSALVAAGLPLVLYALQGTLTYVAYQNLDTVTFNGLTQLNVLSSALCCYLVLGEEQNVMQVASLGLLTISTVVFQGSWKDSTTRDWLSGSMA
jgi:drug/metabolite transporter (DMT)-like permease